MAASDRDALRTAGRRAFELVSGTSSSRIALMQLGSLVGPEYLAPDLRDRAAAQPEPIPFKEIESALKEAWGKAPGKVLGDLDKEPAAVTPGSQVHRGETEDGDPVAVKVLRPGLTEVLRSDLALLEPVAAVLGAVVPGLNLSAIVREVRERLLDELDLEHEAGVQRRVARAVRRDDRFHVPMPDTELSGDRVKVAEWVDGTSARDLTDAGDRQALAEGLAQFTAALPRLAGFAYADPHPDDVLLMEDGRVAVVDWGAARPVERERTDRFAAAVDAFADRDAAALARALDDVGALPGATVEDAELAFEIADDLGGPMLRGEQAVTAEALEQSFERFQERWADTVAGYVRRVAIVPEDLWPMRGAGQAALVIARLEGKADWVSLVREALRD
jgi:predicted unusual protein kinase regulating ubiquinone biosynthesis (AarF/ABC1/UbiB family)